MLNISKAISLNTAGIADLHAVVDEAAVGIAPLNGEVRDQAAEIGEIRSKLCACDEVCTKLLSQIDFVLKKQNILDHRLAALQSMVCTVEMLRHLLQSTLNLLQLLQPKPLL